MNIQKIIAEYPENYCHALELAYGKDMLSEGGTHAIENMFAGLSLTNKKCLDIGFGLGGVAKYLANKYNIEVAGIEINPWMVHSAQTDAKSDNRLTFFSYEKFPQLPFNDKAFDVVYSKGVLVQLEDKQPSFHEMQRVLNDQGTLVIDDWLSPSSRRWSDGIQTMCEIEDLSLYPTSQTEYEFLLQSAVTCLVFLYQNYLEKSAPVVVNSLFSVNLNSFGVW